MPALPVVPNVIKFTVEGTTPAHNWVNVLHWSFTGGPPLAADLNNCCDQLGGLWDTNFTPLMLTSATIAKTTAVDLTSAMGAGSELAVGVNGSRGTAELPGSSSVVVSKTTARRFRGGHARSYILAGIATDMATTSTWAGALVAAVTGAYEAVQTGMNGHVAGGTTLGHEVMVSYMTTDPITHLPIRRVTPLVDAVIAVAAQARIGSQRRRIGR